MKKTKRVQAMTDHGVVLHVSTKSTADITQSTLLITLPGDSHFLSTLFL